MSNEVCLNNEKKKPLEFAVALSFGADYSQTIIVAEVEDYEGEFEKETITGLRIIKYIYNKKTDTERVDRVSLIVNLFDDNGKIALQPNVKDCVKVEGSFFKITEKEKENILKILAESKRSSTEVVLSHISSLLDIQDIEEYTNHLNYLFETIAGCSLPGKEREIYFEHTRSIHNKFVDLSFEKAKTTEERQMISFRRISPTKGDTPGRAEVRYIYPDGLLEDNEIEIK